MIIPLGVNGLDVTVSYEGQTKVTRVTADGYDGIGLTCGSQVDIANSVWQRNGVDINMESANGISVSVPLVLELINNINITNNNISLLQTVR